MTTSMFSPTKAAAAIQLVLIATGLPGKVASIFEMPDAFHFYAFTLSAVVLVLNIYLIYRMWFTPTRPVIALFSLLTIGPMLASRSLGYMFGSPFLLAVDIVIVVLAIFGWNEPRVERLSPGSAIDPPSDAG